MRSKKLAIRSRKLGFSVGLVLILAVGALATGIGIVFQGFETDISTWVFAGNDPDITQEPSGYTDSGGYANGIASATGNYHARVVPDPQEGLCLDDGGPGAPPNNDCYGPYTTWNSFYVLDGVTTEGSNVVTSATANFNPTEVGFNLEAFGVDFADDAFPYDTTITSVINSTTVTVSNSATESLTGAAVNYYPVFTLGYITQLDIYLDTNWAANNNDYRFDWDSGIGDWSGSEFLSDYVFNVGTQLAGDNTPGFWVSTSPNAFRTSTYPENPCPDPENDGLGNYCRAPVKITTSGWYTFRHIFRIDPNTQNLSVEFQVLPYGTSSPVVDTTIYGWQGNAQAPAGGIQLAYGYFPNMEIPELAIDNSLLKDFDTLSLGPTSPPSLAVGATQTFTLSASLFGTPDPLTPGLTSANVTFTNGGSGTVSVVPSGTQPGNGTFSFVATGSTNGSVNLTANIDTAASNTVPFNVTQTQAITYVTPPPPTAASGDMFTVMATGGGSGNPVTFSVGAGSMCTILGATYTMTSDSGYCYVVANQAGSSYYTAAPQVTETVTAVKKVTKIAPTITFTGAPASGFAYYLSSFSVVATQNSGVIPTITALPATVCTISDGVVMMINGTGTCTMKASWATNTYYLAASLTQTVNAEKLTPIVMWADPAPIYYGTNLAAVLNATANVPGTFAYKNGSATVVPGTVLAVGSYTLSVTFTPTADTDYTTATASVPLTVDPVATVTTITSSSTTITLKGSYVSATLDFNVTSYEPTGSVTLTAGNSGVSCTGTVDKVTGNGSCKLTFTATGGPYTISASYSGDANHTGSNNSTQSPPVTVTVVD